MLLAELVETSRRVAATSSRRDKIECLAALLGRLDPEEAPIGIAFLSGSLRQGRLGVGYAMLQESSAPPAATAQLSLADVDRTFEAVRSARGAGAAARKAGLLRELLGRATEAEQQFLRSLLLGELRQGALEGLMLEAVARATGIGDERLRRAVMAAGDLGPVAQAVLARGEAGLADFSIQLFRPLQPMLAQTAGDVAEALEELGEAALEFKLDGARVQAHKSGDEVRIFSRGMKDVTAAVPEVVERVRALPARQLILDGEAIAFRPDGRPHPFQVTMRRFGRKLDVEPLRAALPLTPVWFDLLHLDGGDLTAEPQARRFAELARLVSGPCLIPHLRTASPAEAERFLREATERGHEGIMAKAPGAAYAAGSRGQSWLKIKPAHTLDLVILAAEWGHGRRRGWLSNLHLGARDPESGGFVMLGKTFKGLTDEMLAWQTEELLRHEIARDGITVYVEPKLVVEVAFNEIQQSPRYPGGLALRFARVKRYRTDKTPAEADTLRRVRALAEKAGGA
jgi:DNA ligase-1